MKKSLFLIILLLMFPVVVNAESKYLYDVLKNEAENNGLAREYTGEHHDSFTQEPTKKIYHWYAENNTEGEQVLEKNNVIFGDFCWQIIRTTDTGGIKMIYNGTPIEGNCNNQGSAQQIGYGSYYTDDSSPGSTSYMVTKKYPKKSNSPSESKIYSQVSMSSNSNYYYGTGVTYDTNTNEYTLTDITQNTWGNVYQSSPGLYTCMSASSSSCSRVYYILNGFSRYLYAIIMTDGNLFANYNNIILGSDYTEEDGNYNLTDVISITINDWINNYSTYSNKYRCENNSTSCSTINYLSSTSKDSYKYISSNNNYVYSNSYTYDSETSTYILDQTNRVQFWKIFDDDNLNSLKNNHYTCFNDSGQCSTLSYVFGVLWNTSYYINLSGGTTLNEALEEMLYTNQSDSGVKTKIDNWYQNNLLNYTEHIEDTVFCANRTVKNLGSWNPDNNTINGKIVFEGYSFNELGKLSCNNIEDKFSVSNNAAKLTYPIALLTADEKIIMGNSSLMKTGYNYWLLTPKEYDVYNGSSNYMVLSNGGLNERTIVELLGIRPTISLKPKSRFLSGDGSKANPYIFDESNNYTIGVEINNETEDLTVEIDDLSQVPEGETVNFKVTPIKGRKLTSIKIVDEDNNEIDYTTTDNKNYTFTMPSSDVTIKPSYERVKNAVNVEDNKNTKEFIIEVNDSRAVVYEDTVRFKIEPEDGYEVEKIEITDEGNNKISYKKTSNINEYEFTMPDTNVLIKPYYRLIPTNSSTLINPNTKRQLLLIVISVIILSIMTFLYIKKKKRLT